MKTFAYLNHGRWVADCPRDGCPNAWLAIPNMVLTCNNCGMRSKMIVPMEKTAIDLIMRHRPVPQTQNWRPGEPLDKLLEENAAHGLDYT